MGKKSKKRIRFGSRSEKETPDFVDPNKDPRRYIRRYLLEQNYKDWFDRNYPNYTIYEAVGLGESDYDEIKRGLSSEQEQTPSIEKSQPEPEPEDDDKISGQWTTGPGETSKNHKHEPDESREIPTAEPETTPAQDNLVKKRANKLFWLRIGFAIIGGTMATFLFEGIEHDEQHRWTSIGFMIILFLVTCFMAKGMKINFPRSDRKKIVTTGIGSFIFLYLFAWIMSFTLLNLPQENISIIPGL